MEADTIERVVVDERTGTIVMGRNVNILPVTVMHGALTVEIQTTFEVSQPGPLSQGTTEVVPQTSVQARERRPAASLCRKEARWRTWSGRSTPSAPRLVDVIAILQGLKRRRPERRTGRDLGLHRNASEEPI